MGKYESVELFGIDFTHYRLVDLIALANQAEPFYRWIEKQFQLVTHRADTFETIIRTIGLDQIRAGIRACMEYGKTSDVPKLYDGGGIPYEHKQACYFMFAWMARDAATQRLRPLISKAHKQDGSPTREIEIEALANLLFTYRDRLVYFDWPVIREVTIQRLEGSRRAKRGSAFETYLRSALAQGFSYYYKTHGNYGVYSDFKIWPTPIKINNRTYDAAVELFTAGGRKRMLIIPAKTRETEGGGHAHLFTRDIEQANEDILAVYPDAIIAFMIVAQNWSAEEIAMLSNKYAAVFYFDVNPNEFTGFESQQVRMNILIEGILDGKSI